MTAPDLATPRTDAVVRPHGSPFGCVDTDFARQLERENAALVAALEPFAKFACDEPCDCHNCRARAALALARQS